MQSTQELPNIEAQNVQEYPFILKAIDIMNIMRCSKPKAYDLIREAEETGIFQVRRIGNSPRITRDSFLEWLKGQSPTSDSK